MPALTKGYVHLLTYVASPKVFKANSLDNGHDAGTTQQISLKFKT